MSKFRPTLSPCLYVIPDVHGELDKLKLIFKRIMPLRKSEGIIDRLVMLGDYIDRTSQSPEVLDFLIEQKKIYKDQLILLCGNHELMFLDAMKPSPNSNKYLFWMKFGGAETLSGYLRRAKIDLPNPYELIRTRLPDIVPQEHKNFINDLKFYYETDNFIFVHGGCDPLVPLADQNQHYLAWDRELNERVRNHYLKNNLPLTWEKTIVTGHNGMAGQPPLITDKFMMLDCIINDKLLVVELNTMECLAANGNNKRLVKMDLKDFSAVPELYIP